MPTITASAAWPSTLPGDRDGRRGSQSAPRDAIFPFGHRRTDTISLPHAACRRPLDNARHRAQSSRLSEALATDYRSPRWDRANLGRDGSNLRSRRREAPRSEYSGPTANSPIGCASGPGASRVHSRHAPAGRAEPRQAQSRQDWERKRPPVQMLSRLGRGRTPGSMRAFLSPKGT